MPPELSLDDWLDSLAELAAEDVEDAEEPPAAEDADRLSATAGSAAPSMSDAISVFIDRADGIGRRS